MFANRTWIVLGEELTLEYRKSSTADRANSFLLLRIDNLDPVRCYAIKMVVDYFRLYLHL